MYRLLQYSVIFLGLVLLTVAVGTVSAQQEEDDACALTSYQVEGQGHGVWKMMVPNTLPEKDKPPLERMVAAFLPPRPPLTLQVDPVWIADVANSTFLPEASIEKVAILLIDDFRLPASHGWQVRWVLEQLRLELLFTALENLGLSETQMGVIKAFAETAPLDFDAWLLARLEAGVYDPATAADVAFFWNISIVNVDFSDAQINYRAATITDIVQDQILALSSLEEDSISRFVLNMSFSFIPCEITVEVGELTYAFDFDTFIERFNGSNGEYNLEDHLERNLELTRALLQEEAPVQITNPLRGYIVENNSGGGGQQNKPLTAQTGITIIPVAAAGNHFPGQPQPFYPALWPEVISVSASQGNNLADGWQMANMTIVVSNNGDVTAPGGWYLFADGRFRAGTSFAAPGVSLLLALDQTSGTPQCELDSNGIPELAPGTFNNEPIDIAIGNLC